MKKVTFGIISAIFIFSLFTVNSYAQIEQLVITTYYPSPSGSFNELGVDKLAVNASGDLNGNVVAVASEFAAMQVGDEHIGWSMIIGSGGGSGWAYDEMGIAGENMPVDGDLLVKRNLGIGIREPRTRLEILEGAAPHLRLSSVYDRAVAANDRFVDFEVDANSDLTIMPQGTGQVILQPTTDSTDFFQVLDADAGVPILNVDSVNEQVLIGTTAAQNTNNVLAVRRDQGGYTRIELNNANAGSAVVDAGTTLRFFEGANINASMYYTNNDDQLSIVGNEVNSEIRIATGGVPGTDRINIRGTNGMVGIWNRWPVYTLDVNGDIRATGSVFYGGNVDVVDGIAYTQQDYVFKPGYNALKTGEVEQFLKDNGHLPWMTSIEQEKAENGPVVNMTRMAFQTVETAENLQLQVIELNKVIEAQQENISSLEKKIEKLAGRI